MNLTLAEAKSILEMGLGTASFAVLMVFGWRLAKWGEKVADNHLTHIESGMSDLVRLTGEANSKLDGQQKSLDAHSQMLGIIVDQTKTRINPPMS